jgi:hypothetical protein
MASRPKNSEAKTLALYLVALENDYATFEKSYPSFGGFSSIQ